MADVTTPLLEGLVMRPHHTAVSVADFDKARAFFTDVVGMRLEAEMDRRGERELGIVVGLPGAILRWGMLELAGYRIELFKYYEPEGRPVPIRQCDHGLTHIAFQVNDSEAAYARLREAGYETFSAPQNLRGGVTRPFYAKGPEGIAVEFIQFRNVAPKASAT